MKGFFDKVLNLFFFTGYTIVLLFRTILCFRFIFFRLKAVLDQMFITGIGSLLVVSIVALFTGMIMALNTGLALRDYGAEGQIGVLITITLTREMSPFMTALILAASIGSSMAAEIGTMKVSEEIDALEVMSIDPVNYIIMPRIFGFSLMIPILCVYASAIAILGGAIIGHLQLNVSYFSYFVDVFNRLTSVPGLKDVYVGVFKGFIFGVTISLISCSYGLQTRGGAIGVGKSTRNAVVSSFLMVIFFGYVTTAFFYR